MKVIVQIPCYNEAETLPLVLASIPRQLEGVDRVEVLVVDDGSTDDTALVARRAGADHLVRLPGNRGLASAFQAGLDACLRLGADIIVNTDGDNQYPQSEIGRLIAPILAGTADMVVADRQVATNPYMPRAKRWLQAIGSGVVRAASGTAVPDAPSGFRAFSREAALRLQVLSRYSYTLETLIQAGNQRLRVAHVPVEVNAPRRPSRLMTSWWSYVQHSAATVVRVYAQHQPLKVFFLLGLPPILIGLAAVARFLYFYVTNQGVAGHTQSLVLGAALLIVGFQVMLIGLVADLIGANRRLLEETLVRVKRLEADQAARERRRQEEQMVRDQQTREKNGAIADE